MIDINIFFAIVDESEEIFQILEVAAQITLLRVEGPRTHTERHSWMAAAASRFSPHRCESEENLALERRYFELTVQKSHELYRA